MYTNDERFAILHTPGSNTWTLQIKFVQRRDHGTYECQIKECSAKYDEYILPEGLHNCTDDVR
uniref:Immunoglobulin V-set domain-containing protein n=1 Tax=Anopheles albimanus TaxID=7167 RepID=A0A182F9U6_ANOAL